MPAERPSLEEILVHRWMVESCDPQVDKKPSETNVQSVAETELQLKPTVDDVKLQTCVEDMRAVCTLDSASAMNLPGNDSSLSSVCTSGVNLPVNNSSLALTQHLSDTVKPFARPFSENTHELFTNPLPDVSVELCAESSSERCVNLNAESSLDRCVELCAESSSDRCVNLNAESSLDRCVELCADSSTDRYIELFAGSVTDRYVELCAGLTSEKTVELYTEPSSDCAVELSADDSVNRRHLPAADDTQTVELCRTDTTDTQSSPVQHVGVKLSAIRDGCVHRQMMLSSQTNIHRTQCTVDSVASDSQCDRTNDSNASDDHYDKTSVGNATDGHYDESLSVLCQSVDGLCRQSVVKPS